MFIHCKQKTMQGSRRGDSHESGDVIPPAEESFPLKRVFLSPIMEREARGGMGDRRARDTKRPHFRLLSDLRWDR